MECSWTAGEIAEKLQGELIGDPSTLLRGFTSCDKANEGDLTFAETSDYLLKALATEASGIVIPKALPRPDTVKALIAVDRPRIAFAQILPWFYKEPGYKPGIHPSATVAPTARIDSSAYVGPQCVIEAGAEVGSGCVLISQVYVGPNAKLGAEVRLFPSVTIYHDSILGNRVRIHSSTVIGSDGYGYVFDRDHHRKVPQVGRVIIHDDVEMGACVTIDRGALGDTIVGQGTKIDNHVQIAHNVVIGRHCLIVSQTGIAGSTRLGDFVTLAGQVGVAGHLKIGNQVTVAAQSGVMHDIPDGGKWLGSPAIPDRKMKRILLAMQRLPDLILQFNAFKRNSKNG